MFCWICGFERVLKCLIVEVTEVKWLQDLGSITWSCCGQCSGTCVQGHKTRTHSHSAPGALRPCSSLRYYVVFRGKIQILNNKLYYSFTLNHVSELLP